VTLGKTYPRPIVDHATARARALAAYSTIKKPATPPSSSPTSQAEKAHAA